ncbi:uncharacterized protein LOC135947378 [Cloeon dipterum]|uniref:uncharacterized protein LOC135947378 n=1 Tax=Cloeon dipterum TaxID=197152 RepID=UPI00321FD77E
MELPAAENKHDKTDRVESETSCEPNKIEKQASGGELKAKTSEDNDSPGSSEPKKEEETSSKQVEATPWMVPPRTFCNNWIPTIGKEERAKLMRQQERERRAAGRIQGITPMDEFSSDSD